MRIVLAARSHWSLGLGVSSPEDLARAAAVGDLDALAVADRASMAALPRLCRALPRAIRLPVAAEISLDAAGAPRTVLAYARSPSGRATLAALIAGRPRAGPEGLALVVREPRDVPALAEAFPGAVWVGVDAAAAPARRARLRAVAAAHGLPVIVCTEVVAAADRDRDLAGALDPETPRVRLDEMAARPAPAEDPAILAATERFVADLPDARDLLAGAPCASALLETLLRRAATGLGLRVRGRAVSGHPPAALDIEPHSGPVLAQAAARELPAGGLARASEVLRTDGATAARLAGRALGLGKTRTERLVRAVRAEPDEPGGPSSSALSFHRLDPTDPAVARAAALVPRLRGLPRGLVPGRSLLASGAGPIADRLPTLPQSPVDVVLAEAQGLEELGFAVVALHADAMVGVLGELDRLDAASGGAPAVGSEAVPGEDEAGAARALDALALARQEARRPEAVLCARLRSQPGLGREEIARLTAAARRRGVRVLPPRVDRSAWLPTLEGHAVRLGLAAVLGPSEPLRARWEAMQAEGPPRSLTDLARRSGLPPAALERLASEGALRPFVRDRAEALRLVALLRYREGEELPLFAIR